MAPATLYARLTGRWAVVVTAALVAFALVCGLRQGGVRAIRIDDLPRELGDARLYRAVAARVRAGEGYYDAAALELAQRGYPKGSVFNWRLPAYAWIFGKLPDESWGWLILVGCEVVAVAMATSLVAGAHGVPMQLAVVASLVAADAWILYPEPVTFMEFWAGRFILISLCFYGKDRRAGGIAAGALALILRELATPFCATMLGLALWRRRWREVAAWMSVAAVYAILFGFHSREVARRGASLSPVASLGWVGCGGITSILSTTRMNFLLALLPARATAVYLPLAVLGLLGWPAPGALPMKLTVLVYLGMFVVVGRPSNFYWGWLISSILALGMVRSPVAIRDLISEAVKKLHGPTD